MYNYALIVINMLYNPVAGLVVFIDIILMLIQSNILSVIHCVLRYSLDRILLFCGVYYRISVYRKTISQRPFLLDWRQEESLTRVKRNCLSYFSFYTLCFHLSEPTATPRKDSAMFACSLCVSNSQRQGWT